MVQNMQNVANDVEIGGQAAGATDLEKPKTQVDTLKVIACPVCRAVYVPFFREKKATQNAMALLETAFLGVCRFCFRCQRPACPQCWNKESNLCASCSQEVQVAFHAALPSFEGLVFSPPLSLYRESTVDVSFICRRNGRFASSELAPARALLSADLSVEEASTLDGSYPVWLQEIMGSKTGSQLSNFMPQIAGGWRDSEPVRAEKSPNSPSTSSLEWLHIKAESLPVKKTQATQEDLTVATATSVSEEVLVDEKTPLLERIENILIVLISLILIALVLMIVLAITSADMNALFLRLLHVDIRAEIAYLLKLI